MAGEPTPSPPPETPQSRDYQHRGCRRVTTIGGEEFARLANPFCFVSRTLCAHCGRSVALGSVAWTDTGETVAAYRRRVRAKAPASLRHGGWLIGPLACAGVGIALGWLITPGALKGPAIAGLTGALLGWGFLMPAIVARVWAIDYRTAR